MADTFPISGSIDPRAFPFLLMDLHHNGATGSLKVEGPSFQKALYFRGGRVLFGSSNDPRDQLGAILIESGKITAEQLEDVNNKVGPGNPLAKVLSESGFVTHRELGESARTKVECILSDVIAYETGNFEFEDGVLPKGAVDLKLATERLVLNAVRRLTDRAFVLRFLESLDVVLSPSDDIADRLQGVQPETGGLHEQFDGARTLKEAASGTSLDDFDAGKIACALLFLGLVQKVAVPEVASDAGELDLSQTAKKAFADDEPGPGEAEEPDPAFFVPEAPPPAPSPLASPMTLPFGEEEPPPSAMAPPPPSPHFSEPEPAPAAPPDFPAPEPPATEAPADLGFSPSAEPDPTPFEEPEPPPPPRPAPRERPSSKDLEALDTLLGSSQPEGPLEPFERGGQERWVPKFHGSGGQGSARRQTGRSPLVIVGGSAALLVAAGAAWFFLAPTLGMDPLLGLGPTLGLGPAQPPATVAGQPAPTVPAPTTTPPAPGPEATPSPPPAAASPAATPAPRATPTPRPPPTTQPPRPPQPATGRGPDLGAARKNLTAGALPQAARAFAAAMKAQPRGSYSIQILVACAPETVQKAVTNAPDDRLFVVPVRYQGRDCYRLGWGVYAGEAAARAALGGVPEYFRAGGARPRVISTTSLLP